MWLLNRRCSGSARNSGPRTTSPCSLPPPFRAGFQPFPRQGQDNLGLAVNFDLMSWTCLREPANRWVASWPLSVCHLQWQLGTLCETVREGFWCLQEAQKLLSSSLAFTEQSPLLPQCVKKAREASRTACGAGYSEPWHRLMNTLNLFWQKSSYQGKTRVMKYAGTIRHKYFTSP